MDPGEHGSVLIIGQAGRDLVLRVPELPDAGGSSPVTDRIEILGGKGANQAVGFKQLGAHVALLAVLGDDDAGRDALDDARESDIDVSYIVRRGVTALLVDLVDATGRRRLLEHVPDVSLLRESDIHGAADAFAAADTVCLQLQQPADALLAAAELAQLNEARIVLDGSIEGGARDSLLSAADVVRADASEAAILTGQDVTNRESAERAARTVLDAGPSVVAFAVPGEGNLVVWSSGSSFYPFGDDPVVDVTGAGDAFLAGLVTGLRHGESAQQAGERATAAAAATVGRLGGRPDITGLRPGVGG
jgi:ribokinase